MHTGVRTTYSHGGHYAKHTRVYAPRTQLIPKFQDFNFIGLMSNQNKLKGSKAKLINLRCYKKKRKKN